MEQKLQKQRKKIIGLFSLYLIAITWIILFKFELGVPRFGVSRSLNLIPYGASAIVNGQIDYSEILMNMLAFIPFGLFCEMLFPKKSFFKRCLPFFGVSLAFELLQYLLGIGSTDITDLINNTLGGILGLLVYIGAAKLMRNNYRLNSIILVLASVGSVLMLALMTILIIVNL